MAIYITADDVILGCFAPLAMTAVETNFKAPWVFLWVRELALDKCPLINGPAVCAEIDGAPFPQP